MNILFVIIFLCIYFLPIIISESKKKKNSNDICILNLFFGWTIIGWIIALALATESNKVPQPSVSDCTGRKSKNKRIGSPSKDVYAVQRSEILDEHTCKFCLSIDGLVIKPNDKWVNISNFHENCRGIWVEILKDEQNPPAITGIPDQIKKCYDRQTNILSQPQKAILNQGTPTHDFVHRNDLSKKQ